MADADLRGATLDKCILNGADLSNADLRCMPLPTTATGKWPTRVRGAQLHRVDLRGAKLMECDFSETIFRQADLRGADLTDCKLVDCDLTGADLRDAVIDGVDFRGAIGRV
jgi:uncharacterized protein YjbI with pentapeptide repeats